MSKPSRVFILLFMYQCLLQPAVSDTVHAQDADSSNQTGLTEEGPWSVEVSRKERDAADALFKSANKLLIDDSQEAHAADKYREALEHWRHPAIYFNLSVALQDLEQPIQRYRALLKAVEYGDAPLTAELYEQAQKSIKQMQKEVVEVEVRCDTEGAFVTMNGSSLFTGPGSKKVLMRVGEHNFSATKNSYLPTTKTRAFTPGEQEPVVLYMFRERDLKVPYSRWAKWKPWAVAGGAVAIGALGATLNYFSNQNFATYDELVALNCPGGCPGDTYGEYENRAILQQQLAVAAYTTAGAVLTASVVLMYLNRTRIHEISVEEAERRVTVMPSISGTTASLTARVRF